MITKTYKSNNINITEAKSTPWSSLRHYAQVAYEQLPTKENKEMLNKFDKLEEAYDSNPVSRLGKDSRKSFVLAGAVRAD